jgi:hypothetical protein
MESTRFDAMARVLAGMSSRRRFSGTLAALGLGSIAGLGLLGGDDAEAKKKAKKVTLCHSGQTIRVGKRKVKKHLSHGDTRGACPVGTPVDTIGLQQPCSSDYQCVGDLVCQIANSQNGNPERANQPVCCVPPDVQAKCDNGSDCCGVSVICNGGYCQGA